MKKKFLMIAAFLLVFSMFLVPTNTKAAGSRSVETLNLAVQKAGKAKWVKINGNYYFYRKNGQMKYGWVYFNGKRYYTDPITGVRLTGWQTIKGKTYYFNKKKGYMHRSGMWKIQGSRYYFKKNGTLYKGLKTINGKNYYFGETGAAVKGFQVIGDYTYYFRTKGYMYKGWLTKGELKYYFNKSDSSRPLGAMSIGLTTIDGAQYFFGEDGVLIRDDFALNGKLYSFDANGRCTVSDIPTNDDPSLSGDDDTTTDNGVGLSDDFLFFTVYESGRSSDFYAGYNQTGGDRGNACGKYQFDYRYSLLPFVKYCYSKDPVFFAEFEPYAKLSLLKKSELQGNTEFYKAWNTIFAKNKVKFANYQDVYAKEEYYDITERYLLNYGIDISKRPDVVKGAVYSYSIQHGQLTAAKAVVAAKITNATSDLTFIKRLYNYRIKTYPTYTSRYSSERTEALRRLRLAAANTTA